MLSKEEARKVAENFVSSMPFGGGDDDGLVILDEYTLEKEFGWIFSYNTKKFKDTQDYDYALLDNNPFIVNKRTGQVKRIRGGPFFEESLAEYEESLIGS